MRPSAGHFVSGERPLAPPVARNADCDYRRLLAALASRAGRLGSRDPESAAQETLKRSLENAAARPAVDYYFSDRSSGGSDAPEWPLDRLFAWLHAALHFVVREEQSRAAFRREFTVQNAVPDAIDPSPDA